MRHKARLVARGDMTHVIPENSYNGVVTMEIMFLTIFVTLLNNLQAVAADISNAY